MKAAGLLLIGLLPTAAHAQPPEAEVAPTIYLVTMGPGDQVWEKFAHNAIWVHDPATGTDLVYNYGVFDFHAPGYWSRFVQGTWIYQMGVNEMDVTLAHYRYLNRTVLAQELNLSPDRARAVQRFLVWNSQPANSEYLYDYYRDNCSTRVRDVIDGAVGGALRAATQDVPTRTTYRWHSTRLLARDPLPYAGLQAGLGPAADVPISAWEEMFLPTRVSEWVGRIQVRTAAGPEPLVRSEHVLYQAAERPPVPEAPPRRIPAFLLIGAAVAALLAGLASLAARSRVARFGFATVSSLWASLVGTGGLVLLGLWAFTDHEIAYRNENLFQFNPLLLPLALLLPALAYGAAWAARPARALALAAAGISVLGFALQPLPWLDQVNGEIIALILPVNLAIAWAATHLARTYSVTAERTSWRYRSSAPASARTRRRPSGSSRSAG